MKHFLMGSIFSLLIGAHVCPAERGLLAINKLFILQATKNNDAQALDKELQKLSHSERKDLFELDEPENNPINVSIVGASDAQKFRDTINVFTHYGANITKNLFDLSVYAVGVVGYMGNRIPLEVLLEPGFDSAESVIGKDQLFFISHTMFLRRTDIPRKNSFLAMQLIGGYTNQLSEACAALLPKKVDEILQANKESIRQVDFEGWDVLHNTIASAYLAPEENVIYGDIFQIVTSLINAGVNPDGESSKRGPYMQAAILSAKGCGRMMALNALLENGGDPYQKASNGRSAYDIALAVNDLILRKQLLTKFEMYRREEVHLE